MIDFSKPVQTRAGRPARLLCTDALGYGGKLPILALVRVGDDHDIACRYYSDGRSRTDADSDNDLVNAPVRQIDYFNVYKRADATVIYGASYKTIEDCRSARSEHHQRVIGIVKTVSEDDKIISMEVV